MKRALKWLGVTLLFIVSFITVAYWLAKKYEDPVRNFILKEVNKRLASPVHVSDINFSLLENFPSASLVMDSIWAEENIVKIGNPDTLLFFEKLYLNLNIFEIINGKYKISGIEARRGFTHLLVDKKGYDNYHIWKETDDTTGFLLELSAVHFNDVKLRYINLSRNQDYNIEADEMWFKGKFSDEEYTMSVKGDGIVHHFRLDETDYIIERQIAVESELEINAETESYAFKKGRLLIDNELDFVVSGKLESDRIDLKIAGDNLDIIKTIALIPGESRR